MTEFVVIMTGFGLNVTGLVPNMIWFVLNMTGFVLNMTGFVQKQQGGCQGEIEKKPNRSIFFSGWLSLSLHLLHSPCLGRRPYLWENCSWSSWFWTWRRRQVRFTFGSWPGAVIMQTESIYLTRSYSKLIRTKCTFVWIFLGGVYAHYLMYFIVH